MTTIVVGGQSRKTGKTSVAAGLISAFREHSWTAVKVSAHGGDPHAPFPGTGVPPALHQTGIEIYEETVRDGKSDSSRYLVAGAARSFWIKVRSDHLGELMPHLDPILKITPFRMIESNAVLNYLRPDLYVMVFNCRVEDFKESAKATLSRADALVVVNWDPGWSGWQHFPSGTLSRIPLFKTPDPAVLPSGLISLIRSRL